MVGTPHTKHAQDRQLLPPSLKVTESNAPFAGFPSLEANYVFCPNQFFDVCLPNCSRGAVRIVAYVLRQTLGWLDANGEPVRQDIQVTYRQLIEKAGVSRGAIGSALQEAIERQFLIVTETANANTDGRAAQSASYRLKWGSDGFYAKSNSDFDGFFTGEGHRTPIPNAFFDDIVPTERLAVVKLVGAVLRHTVGYQNQFGGRRQQAALSYSYMQRYTNLASRSKLSSAIDDALQAGFIARVDEGLFDPDPARQHAAVYAIRWQNQVTSQTIGSEKEPATERSKTGTSNGSEKAPANRFKMGTSTKTVSNDTNKQQPVAVETDNAVERLVEAGVDRSTAQVLATETGEGTIQRQLTWLDARNPTENRVGMLIKSIRGDWSAPSAFQAKRKREEQRSRQQRQRIAERSGDAMQDKVKHERALRRLRLLAEWGSADRMQRVRWIESAALVETSRVLQEIIRKQRPETSSPDAHVLNVIATERRLPSPFVESV